MATVPEDTVSADEDPTLERLYPYQRVGSRWLRASRAALLADDMGLGKSAQSLTALRAIGAAGIVVCPPALRRQWRAAAQEWGGYHWSEIELVEGGRAAEGPEPRKLLIIGYSFLRRGRVIPVHDQTVLIADEAQAVKNPSAQQTSGLRALADAVRRGGGAVWLLTATPARARAAELWEVLRAAGLARHIARSADAADLDPIGVRQRLRRICLRRTPEDVGLELPEIVRVREDVTLPQAAGDDLERLARAAIADRDVAAAGQAAYSEARAAGASVDDARAARDRAKEDAREAADERVGALLAAEAEAELAELLAEDGSEPGGLSRLRAALARAKTPRALELATEAVRDEEPVVIGSAHRIVGETLRDRGLPALLGGLAPKARAHELARFVEGEADVIAGTLACMAEGVDGLQRRSRHLVIVDLDWTPAVTAQFMGRLRRVGASAESVRRGVVVRTLVADHWVDQVVWAVAESKIERLEELGLGVGEARP